MVSESDTKCCARKDAATIFTSGELGLLQIVSKSDTVARCAKEDVALHKQYLLAVGLSCYKWYQSQTPSVVLGRILPL